MHVYRAEAIRKYGTVTASKMEVAVNRAGAFMQPGGRSLFRSRDLMQSIIDRGMHCTNAAMVLFADAGWRWMVQDYPILVLCSSLPLARELQEAALDAGYVDLACGSKVLVASCSLKGENSVP